MNVMRTIGGIKKKVNLGTMMLLCRSGSVTEVSLTDGPYAEIRSKSGSAALVG